MPSYDYLCPSCGSFTVRRPITVNDHPDCPTCQRPARRVFAPVALSQRADPIRRPPRLVRKSH